jgi:hypothetical protein
MTYEEALEEARTTGASRASDPALMAMFCDANLQILVGAVAPKLVWEGAQAREMTTQDLAQLCSKNPLEVHELMW